MILGWRERAQQLRVLVAPPEDTGSILSVDMDAHSCTSVTPVAGDPLPLLASSVAKHTHGAQTYVEANIQPH